MRNLKLTLSYDGSEFSGWQTQPGRRTVQQTLETAIARATSAARVRCNVSGRTDAGVHALGQVVNFYSETRLPPVVLRRAINAHLPGDVAVLAVEDVPESFDANQDARRKLYRYHLHDGPVMSVFLRRYAWHVRWPLDLDAMRRAARPLIGTHDFHSFETGWPNRLSSIRTISRLEVQRRGSYLFIDVEADGFLYNMVRAIAGTLVNVGRGYWLPDITGEILAACDRRRAGPNAPARGLFLVKVFYE